ncbi:MAG: tetratricopeptide repeat protein, partial [Anaerolineae bacterium]|nr:tetratricopeptide repeat protein [Anaerolineae bacterium]
LLILLVLVDKKDLSKTVKVTWPLFAVAGLFGSVYLFMAGPRFSIAERLGQIGFEATDLTATAISFAGWYVSRILCPEGLVFMINRVSPPHLLVWSIAPLAGAALLYYLYKAKRTCAVFALGWFLTGSLLIPVAMLGHPSLGAVFEPHWLYFSSYGLFLLLARLMLNIYRGLPRGWSYGLTACLVLGWMLVTHLQLRQLADEKTYCQYLLHHYPENQMAKSTLANIYFREGDHRQAKALYKEILAGGDGQHFRELNNLGLIYHDLGQWDMAVDNLQAALAVNPDFAPAWNNLGQVIRDRGDPDQAVQFFEQAVVLDPYLPAARLNLSHSYMLANRWALAAETLSALEISSLKPFYQREALMQLCAVALKQGNTRWSQDLLQELRTRFGSAETQLLLVQKLINTRLSIHAGPLLDSTLREYPDHKEAYLMLGAFLGNQQQWDKAIAVWDAGRARFPDEPLFRSYIAEAQKLRDRIPSRQ